MISVNYNQFNFSMKINVQTDLQPSIYRNDQCDFELRIIRFCYVVLIVFFFSF